MNPTTVWPYPSIMTKAGHTKTQSYGRTPLAKPGLPKETNNNGNSNHSGQDIYHLPSQKYAEQQFQLIANSSFRKEEQVKQLGELNERKRFNIEEISQKIKKIVSQASFEQSPIHSFVKENQGRERFRTEYDCSQLEEPVRVLKLNLNGIAGSQKLGPNKQKLMVGSKIIAPTFSSVERQIFKGKSANKYQLQRIRSKYQKSESKLAFSIASNSKCLTEDSPKSDIYQLKFDQTFKPGHSKNLSRGTNLTQCFLQQKQKSVKKSICVGKKKDIDEEIALYQKKVDGYNCKKEALLNQFMKKHVPLQDRTHLYVKNNQTHSQNQDNEKSQFKDKVECGMTSKSEEESEPPTADFRMREESNDLQVLLKNLINQIKVDQKFRSAKKWFDKCTSQSKWKQLNAYLQKFGVFLDEQSLKQIFALNPDQQNPFYTLKPNDFTIESVAEMFVRCEQNWFTHVVKKFYQHTLESEGFKQRKIDISQKGYLDVQDLVRFLNLEMDCQFRSRDMYLICLRLKGGSRLTFKDIIEVICY